MDDLLLNYIQVEEVSVRVDTRTNLYYPDDPSAKLVTFPDGTTMPVFYDGALMYLKVISLNKDEVQNCRKIQLS